VRVQAEEARLADHFAFVVEALDADVVEMPGPMHGGARVRLGEHQQLLHPSALARLGRQRGEARGNGLAALAQDAKAAARNDAQHVLAIDGGEVIAAAAQEREVVLQEPGEEGALLVVAVRRQPLDDLAMRACIGFQSSTAARTSARTLAMPASSSTSFAASVWRSTSMCMKDSSRPSEDSLG